MKILEQQNQSKKLKTTQSIQSRNPEGAFVISHTFKTDSKTLFNMWVNPETYTNWMGPEGAEMSFINADIREGGTAFWQMLTSDNLTKFGKLHYKTIKPHDQLIYVQNFCDKDGNFIKAPFSETYPDSLLLSVNFDQEGNDQVKMTITWEIFGDSDEIEIKTFNDMKPFMIKGWNESFNKIEALLKLKKND